MSRRAGTNGASFTVVRATRLAATTAILGMLVAVGCGGDDETTTTATPTPQATGAESGAPEKAGAKPSSPSDEQQIRSTVGKLLTSTDPDEVCAALVTKHYVDSSFGGRQGCERGSVPGSAADSVSVSDVQVESGGSATAKAVPEGGPSNGETLTVALVNEGGTWKVDRLRSNAPVGP
jgi:hypothetical protein